MLKAKVIAMTDLIRLFLSSERAKHRTARLGCTLYDIRRWVNVTSTGQFRDPEVEEFRMNLYEAKTPLLGKGGVAAPSRNIPVPLKGADGEAVKKLESSAIPLLA